MKYYAIITNGIIDGKGQCPCTGEDTFSIEITEDIYNNLNKYKWSGFELIIDPEYKKRELELKKQEKYKENEILRDKALVSGVLYRDVLFDSDTDQKINLLAMLQTLPDTGTIVWYGMDNKMLICNKLDLIEIGDLITKLHNFVWNRNAEIQNKILNAENEEDLNKVEINYNFN